MCYSKQTYILMCFCLQDRESELGMLDHRTKSFKFHSDCKEKLQEFQHIYWFYYFYNQE